MAFFLKDSIIPLQPYLPTQEFRGSHPRDFEKLFFAQVEGIEEVPAAYHLHY